MMQNLTRFCVFCVQDGRDSAVTAAESGCPGADCCGHGGHHEGLQGKLAHSSRGHSMRLK